MKHLHEFAYTEEDDAFYARAIKNYPDHVTMTPKHNYKEGWAGPVNGTTPAYEPDELEDIIRQGRDRPRPLTYVEDELARRNRRIAREDLAAMEDWYRSEIKTKRQRSGPEDEALSNIVSEDVWRPVAW